MGYHCWNYEDRLCEYYEVQGAQKMEQKNRNMVEKEGCAR